MIEWEDIPDSCFGILRTAFIAPIGMSLDVAQEWDYNQNQPVEPPRYQGAIPDLDLFTEYYTSIRRAEQAAEQLAIRQVLAALAELAPERNHNGS